MKKLLSTILSIAILAASAAVPVLADEVVTEAEEIAVAQEVEELAEEELIEDEFIEEDFELFDYVSAEYDVEQLRETFDDGAVDNTIDGTKALQIGETMTRVFSSTLDTTKEFYLGFDFCFDNANGDIEIPDFKSSGAVNKVGPIITTDSGNLRTQTGSSSYQDLGAISLNTWYSAEIEGRTGMGQQYTTFRLYSYEGGVKTLVKETTNFSMRNLSSEGRSFNGMQAHDVSLDNIVLIRENPDRIEVSAMEEEVNAGQTNIMDYVMFRGETETTKYAVTWSVNDDAQNVTINSNGVLSPAIDAPAQTVTVTASVVFGEKTLTGTKDIAINAINTDNEKFDTIEVSGSASIKSGEETAYAVKAYKGEADVTDTLEDGDVVWSVYDYANVNQVYAVENAKVSVDNGVLKVADGVLPQTVTVRASSKSGNVYGSKTVEIAFADSQVEPVVYNNAFETNLESANKAVSIDGSIAYLTTGNDDIWAVANQSGYTLTEMDIKFTGNGSGFTLMRRDGQKTNTSVTYSDGSIRTNSGTLMDGVDTETWYHIELVYSNTDASCNIYTYNADGTLGTAKTILDIDRRNAEAYGRLRLNGATYVDNIIISTPKPNDVKITAPGQYMFAGDKVQYSATATRNGLPLKGYSDFEWSVLDASELPIIDGSISVNESGVLTSDPMVPEQTVTVKVAVGEAWDSAKVTIQSSEIFSVTNIGINEEGTEIVKLYVDKNFYYDDQVLMVVAIKNNDGRLEGIRTVSTYGDRLNIGSNEMTISLELPENFSADTHTVEVMVWTTI